MNTFWRVTVALLAIGAVVSLVTLTTGNRPIGSENLVGHRTPDFAAPLASGKLVADSNIYTRPQARAANSVAACDVSLSTAFNSCRDLGRAAILTFWNTTKPECVAQVEELDGYVAKQTGITAAAVVFDQSEDSVRDFLKGRKIQLAVPIDRDGAVAGLYAVAVCPTTFFIGDGRILGVKLGRLSRQELTDGLSRAAPTAGGD